MSFEGPPHVILWIEDILRPTTLWPWGMFDLAREPIRQGCGVDMGHPMGSGKCLLAPGFDPDTFRAMVPRPPEDAPWRWSFRNIPETARSYINQAIPSGVTVLSFEMPPWLGGLCEERKIPYADIRVSPLRFARDLYLAIRTNSPELHRRLVQEAVPEEEVRLEAGMLAASVRMHQDFLDEQQRYPVRLGGCLVFVGQAPFDTSLIDEQDRPLRCQDYADRIASLARGRTVLHKPHPMAQWFADEERASLSRIVGRDVPTCRQNAYQVLASRDDVELVGISSGMLQEARYFGKVSHTLFRPFVPVASPSDRDEVDAYLQLRFERFLSPGFWHRFLAPETPPPLIDELPRIQPNHLRETSTFWWDYSKVMTWQRPHWIEAFERSGGGMLRARVERLETAVWPDGEPFGAGTGNGPAPARISAGAYTMQSAAELPIDSRVGRPQGFSAPTRDLGLRSGERQVGVDYDSIRADHRFRYEWADERLPAPGFGLDAFCGSGYGTWLLSKRRDVLGIDGSPDAIRHAERHFRAPHARFSVGYYPFELPTEAFDFVVSLESIEHVADGPEFFAMLARSLAPGGSIAFSVPCEDSLPHSVMKNPFHVRHYTLQESRDLISANGLELVEWAGQDVYAIAPGGRLGPILDDEAMRLESARIGQFVVFLATKRAR